MSSRNIGAVQMGLTVDNCNFVITVNYVYIAQTFGVVNVDKANFRIIRNAAVFPFLF